MRIEAGAARMTRRMGYLILAVNLSLLVWAGVIYGLSSLIGGDSTLR